MAGAYNFSPGPSMLPGQCWRGREQSCESGFPLGYP